jgi:flagellin-like hook-associated protein FlgL
MRITTRMIYRNMQHDLNKLSSDTQTINKQISSGKQLSTISDNPAGLVSALGLRSEIAAISQYQENLACGETMVTAAETALTQMKDLLMQADNLTLQANNATMNQADRDIVAGEINSLYEQAIALANTQISGKYIFAGFRTSGYTESEATPFIGGLADGYQVSGSPPAPLSLPLTAAEDANGDGIPDDGYQLGAGELSINGIEIGQPQADADSTILADTSATAKAAAINAISAATGLSAAVTPARIANGQAVAAGTLASNDLFINGVDIFSSPTVILDNDADNALITAINSQSGATGVTATRNSSGQLILSALDGRNVQIQTSDAGEAVSHVNGATPASARNMVYFGTVFLASESPFTLNATATGALAALGLDGGTAITGEDDDTAGDGALTVDTLARQQGNVRYAGDEHDVNIKIGASSTLTIAVNGQSTVADTGIFEVLYSLQQNLLGEKYSAATGSNAAENTTALLIDNATGLEDAEDGTVFCDGSFTVTVTDHAVNPPGEFTVAIPINTAYDSLDSVAAKIDGVPGLASYWDADGLLHVESSDTERYSFSLSNDSSNFLQLSGLTEDTMQSQALERSLADIQQCMQEITAQVSACGATYNRIEVQNRIYDDLDLVIRENLSNKEDTDLAEAAMQLSAKSTAYEAALAAATKVMKLSLVDFL